MQALFPKERPEEYFTEHPAGLPRNCTRADGKTVEGCLLSAADDQLAIWIGSRSYAVPLEFLPHLARFSPLSRHSRENEAIALDFGGWRKVLGVTRCSESGGSRAHSKDAPHPGDVRSSFDSSSLSLRHRKPIPLPSHPST